MQALKVVEKEDRIYYMQLRYNIFFLPGENPNSATLRGTNVYIIGTGKKRTMLDAADLYGKNAEFMENLRLFMKDYDV